MRDMWRCGNCHRLTVGPLEVVVLHEQTSQTQTLAGPTIVETERVLGICLRCDAEADWLGEGLIMPVGEPPGGRSEPREDPRAAGALPEHPPAP